MTAEAYASLLADHVRQVLAHVQPGHDLARPGYQVRVSLNIVGSGQPDPSAPVRVDVERARDWARAIEGVKAEWAERNADRPPVHGVFSPGTRAWDDWAMAQWRDEARRALEAAGMDASGVFGGGHLIVRGARRDGIF
jgi:hypothetical protein